MKPSKFLIVTLLCVGLASAADARNKGHRHKGKRGKKHQPIVSATPAPPVPPAPAGHHTITPYEVSHTSPGVWNYDASLSSGLVKGNADPFQADGFTIFDFGGYVSGSIFAPTGWDAIAVLTGSVLNAPPPVGHADDPALFNLLFRRTGGDIGPTNGIIASLGGGAFFGATTTFTGADVMTGWSSRDHQPATPFGPGNPAANFIIGPGPGNSTHVPDGGATVALLGIGLTGLEALRRIIRARKA